MKFQTCHIDGMLMHAATKPCQLIKKLRKTGNGTIESKQHSHILDEHADKQLDCITAAKYLAVETTIARMRRKEKRVWRETNISTGWVGKKSPVWRKDMQRKFGAHTIAAVAVLSGTCPLELSQHLSIKFLFLCSFAVYVRTRQERRCRRGIISDNEQLPSPKNQGTLQPEKRRTNPFRGISE